MTELYIGREGEGFYIEAVGHSGYGTKGNDLVCAGISTLIFAEIELTRKMESVGELTERRVSIGEGYARVFATPKNNKRELLAGAFALAETGLKLLAETQPEFVRIIRKEQKDEEKMPDGK